MRSVEDQLQKTFLPKIFKSQQDLRKLQDATLQVWGLFPLLTPLWITRDNENVKPRQMAFH